jgi:putative transcriptional regulator
VHHLRDPSRPACQAPLTAALLVKHACQVRNRVSELRTASAMSQGELAKLLGVSRQTINSIENGRYLPSLPLALAIARNFEQAVEAIFISDEEEGS